MIQVTTLDSTPRFDKQLSAAPPDIRTAAFAALDALVENPSAGKLRLHRIKGYNPALWKIDIFQNKSWQIAFELHGSTAKLRFLGRHRTADRL
ncbi:MAG: type II toxin-antitoxin system RelE family toxin [Propionivibrio sp.]